MEFVSIEDVNFLKTLKPVVFWNITLQLDIKHIRRLTANIWSPQIKIYANFNFSKLPGSL